MRRTFDPFRLLLISVAGWLGQQQRDAIDYLREATSAVGWRPRPRYLAVASFGKLRPSSRLKRSWPGTAG
jgi:hypothetical protein